MLPGCWRTRCIAFASATATDDGNYSNELPIEQLRPLVEESKRQIVSTSLYAEVHRLTGRDIIAAVALYRPGPREGGMVDQFIECKHGRRAIEYPHELLTSVLRETYGVFVYQEQVMQAAQLMAGYSLGAADLMRRAMGKKKKSELDKQFESFEAGMLERSFSPAAVRAWARPSARRWEIPVPSRGRASRLMSCQSTRRSLSSRSQKATWRRQREQAPS